MSAFDPPLSGRARIRVPATSANLGPGFDCLGLAVSLYNEVTLAWGETPAGLHLEVAGQGADTLPRDATHLLVKALTWGLRVAGGPPLPDSLHVRQDNRIPLSRGLGSSAATIVAGLAGALVIAGRPLDRAWLLREAHLMEGHPDNVAAAIHGGLAISLVDDEGKAVAMPLPPPSVHVAFAVPRFRVSTHEARSVLPSTLPLASAVFTSTRASLLVAALLQGRHEWLREATRDCMHTPWRAPQVRRFEAAREAALEAGALGVFISGSGPTVGAFAESARAAGMIADRMVDVFQEAGLEADALAVPLDEHGVCRLES